MIWIITIYSHTASIGWESKMQRAKTRSSYITLHTDFEAPRPINVRPEREEQRTERHLTVHKTYKKYKLINRYDIMYIMMSCIFIQVMFADTWFQWSTFGNSEAFRRNALYSPIIIPNSVFKSASVKQRISAGVINFNFWSGSANFSMPGFIIDSQRNRAPNSKSKNDEK